jgi:hypothetical protein
VSRYMGSTSVHVLSFKDLNILPQAANKGNLELISEPDEPKFVHDTVKC